jgi:ATP-dependent Clp protease ATP-binding subunit ClpA
MFERFTSQSRQVVKTAQEEARRLRHPAIGTEHLLIGLLEDRNGPPARLLRERGLEVAAVRRRVTSDDGLDQEALAVLGIDLEQVRSATEETFGPGALDPRARGPVRDGHLPISRRAKKALELALREAVRLKHREIATGHLLLGLLREGQGLAVTIIADAGIDVAELRAEVDRLLTSEAA